MGQSQVCIFVHILHSNVWLRKNPGNRPTSTKIIIADGALTTLSRRTAGSRPLTRVSKEVFYSTASKSQQKKSTISAAYLKGIVHKCLFFFGLTMITQESSKKNSARSSNA